LARWDTGCYAIDVLLKWYRGEGGEVGANTGTLS
jgi:hypothetical protein